MADSTINAASGSKTATRTTKAGGKAVKPAAKASAKGKASAARDGTAKEGAAKVKASPSAAKKDRNSSATADKAVARTRKGAGKRIVLGGLSADQRRRMIEEQAYYRAERRGFQGGSATEDWLAAEAEVDRMLAEGKPLAL